MLMGEEIILEQEFDPEIVYGARNMESQT